ncbi:GNVR domain-containing protein [Hoeflea sp.]|uniref:GumC family protein n=1 Tax=Hoeflea sp. TaxID=1940281 RepID=UPI0019B45E37|nr:GNVR domain-containing protein [Hoeflea sp.]MBC7280357.1 hypothetical protein [Hoeflea sp.]
MSDSTKDRRPHARRGSLLDHAGEAPHAPLPQRVPARESSGAGELGQVPARPAAARPAPSLLSAPSRTARLSTARYAADRHEAAPSPAEAAPPPAPARTQPAPSSHEKFGDKIARLIGTIPPQASEVPSPAARDDQAAPRRENPSAPDMADQASPQRDAEAQHDAPRAPAMRQADQGHDDHYHWHAAASGGSPDDGSRPLLDASILISAVVRYWKQIAAAAFIGALLGVLVALSTPHRYYAESRLFIDPREIQVTEDDIRNQQLSTEAMLAITDSQLQILSSTSVLQKVIADLGLDRDPEFNGSLSTGSLAGGLALIKELFTGAGGPSDAEQTALETLRDSLSVSRDAKTFVIIVGVSSRDPQKSALIANRIVETYLDSEGQAQSSLLERTSESIDTRINALRADLDAAEREVERFKAENGLVGVGGQYIDDKVILALSDQLANARAMKVGIRVKANNLANVNIDAVLSGAFPEELLSSNLIELRKQFTESRSSAESLATSLGPRHPRYIAAKSALDTIRAEISAELRRIVASSQTELQRAVETEQELASQMAVAKSRAMDQSVDFVTLRELERKAAATRGIYEAFLTRSRETSERSNFSTRNVRVISPAEAPLQPMGPSRKLIAIGGLFAGFFAGLGLALLAGAVESIRAYNSGPVQARFQTPPFGDYPVAPNPGPRTPPSGPARRRPSGRNDESGTDFDRAADQATATAFIAPRAQREADPVRHEPAPAQREPLQQPAAVADGHPVPPRPLPQARFQPAAADAPDTDPYAGHEHARRGFEPAYPAHGFMPAQPQPGWQPQPAAPAPHPAAPFAAAPHPGAQNPRASELHVQDPHIHYPHAQDPRMGQPLWTADPAQGQAQSYPYPVYSYQPAPGAGHAAFHHAPQPGSAAPQSGYGMPPAAYGVSYPSHAAPQPAPAWPQAAPPMHHPAPQPYAAAYQPAPAHVSPPAPAPQPARTDAVDRIRRDMDVLRSRIDGYGTSRRRA